MPMSCGRWSQETRHVYDEARKRYESRNEELGVRAKKLDEQEQANTALGEQLDVRDSELAEERAALDKRVDEATEWEKTLSERETEVRKREFNAERGFTKERLEMQSQLDEARDSFRAGFARGNGRRTKRVWRRGNRHWTNVKIGSPKTRAIWKRKSAALRTISRISKSPGPISTLEYSSGRQPSESSSSTGSFRSKNSLHRPAVTGTGTTRSCATGRTPTASSANAQPMKCWRNSRRCRPNGTTFKPSWPGVPTPTHPPA